jgi:hypothetical protein
MPNNVAHCIINKYKCNSINEHCTDQNKSLCKFVSRSIDSPFAVCAKDDVQVQVRVHVV